MCGIVVEQSCIQKQKDSSFTHLRDLVRHGSESLKSGLNAAAKAAIGLSLAGVLFGQSDGIVMYQNMLPYSDLSTNGSYILAASTDEHCYIVGISTASEKQKLFIRVEDPYTRSPQNMYTCGYQFPKTNSPIKEDELNRAIAETTINPGEKLTASITIGNGKVELSIAGEGQKLSSEVGDSGTTFKWPAHHTIGSKSKPGIPDASRRGILLPPTIVNNEVAQWEFLQESASGQQK
jgi:hypothetical protein